MGHIFGRYPGMAFGCGTGPGIGTVWGDGLGDIPLSAISADPEAGPCQYGEGDKYNANFVTRQEYMCDAVCSDTGEGYGCGSANGGGSFDGRTDGYGGGTACGYGTDGGNVYWIRELIHGDNS